MDSSELMVPAESHENRGPQIQGVVILFVVLTTVSVSLRSYCRAFVIKSFGWDDISIVLSWVSSPPHLTIELTLRYTC